MFKEQDVKTRVQVKVTRLLIAASILAGTLTGAGFAAAGQVTHTGKVAGFIQSPSEASTPIDFANAKPIPLPEAAIPAVSPFKGGISKERFGKPGMKPGAIGTGKTIPGANAAQTDAEERTSVGSGRIQPEEYGTEGIPYTTSRVDLTSANNESKSYPYRAAGKLYFLQEGTSYVCTASLIQPGVIVTAAHCVANFGQSQFYSGWVFIPGMSGSKKPYGQWHVSKAWVMQSYYDGSDSCQNPGVVCQNDVAVLAVLPNKGKLPGTATGWFGYAWDGWGFTGDNTAQISQLGYPVSHDDGMKMQRTDSQGFVSNTMSNNTVWGTRQTGGSSGGPEVVNLGIEASLSGIDYGSYSDFNYVVGVTSWGKTDDTVKEQGASSFTSDNIVTLVDEACNYYARLCQ